MIIAQHALKTKNRSKRIIQFAEALSPAFIHAADLWPHHFSAAYAAAGAEQQLQMQQQALLHPALQQQLQVRSFL